MSELNQILLIKMYTVFLAVKYAYEKKINKLYLINFKKYVNSIFIPVDYLLAYKFENII